MVHPAPTAGSAIEIDVLFGATATWYSVPMNSEQSKSNITHSTSTNADRVQHLRDLLR